jgi:arylformamidase
LIDISPRLRPGHPTWPGDAPTEFRWTERMAHGARANVGALSCSTHAGAHVDAPLHVIAGGGDVTSLPLDAFWGRARVVEIRAAEIGTAELAEVDWDGVERVLFRTGGAGYLDAAAAAYLIERKIRLVGIDSMSVDLGDHPEMPVHRAFARAGVAILECLRLEHARAGDYELAALPLAFEGADASPVRAVLKTL